METTKCNHQFCLKRDDGGCECMEDYWIDIKDELPKFNEMFSERVLGCDIKHGEIKVVSLYKNYEGRYVGYNTTQGEYMMNVSHWMPLPNLPKIKPQSKIEDES